MAAQSSRLGGEDQSGQSSEPTPNPFDYYCFPRPLFDLQRENNEKEADEQLDEDELIDAFNEEVRDAPGLCDKPAAKFPNHKWINMFASWEIFAEYKRRASYTCPDNFNMYIYNDFNGYGLQEFIENLLVAFNEEFKKSGRDEANVKQMWAIVAGMAYWLNDDEFGPWIGCDDGDQVQLTASLIGRAFLTSLNELHLAGMLKADSEIKDLGLVLSMYLEWFDGLVDYGIDESDVECCKEAVAYARTANIDLEAVGCYSVKELVNALEKEHGSIGPLKGAAKADRWAWKKNFKKLKNPGGEKHNILKMSSRERAQYSFDKKDPLKGISKKDLLEGNIMLA